MCPMPAYPQMFRVRQKFDSPRLDDIPAAVRSELAGLNLQRKVKPGQSVAITAGSRGIANIHLIIKAAVQYFQSLGAKPFIGPAMGSHGATPLVDHPIYFVFRPQRCALRFASPTYLDPSSSR
jgi:hypothetical protein